LIANSTVDLECGSTTNNLERQKQVSFTITHFVTANRFVSKKAAKLNKLEDLKARPSCRPRHHQHQADHRAERRRNSGFPDPAGQGSRDLPDGRDRPRRLRDGRHPALQLVAGSKAPKDYGISADALGRTLRHHAARGCPAFKKWSMTP
jgi:glutamate/aspartate transport system substrate-binding protein